MTSNEKIDRALRHAMHFRAFSVGGTPKECEADLISAGTDPFIAYLASVAIYMLNGSAGKE